LQCLLAQLPVSLLLLLLLAATPAALKFFLRKPQFYHARVYSG